MRNWHIVLITICFASNLAALPTVVPDPVRCVKEIETHFFQDYIVNQGLSLYNIREELWVPINMALQRNSTSVEARMIRKTAFMVPNPLEYPMQRGATAKLLKDALYEVFVESVKEYWNVDSGTAKNMFEYIFAQQFQQFIDCFGEEAKSLLPTIEISNRDGK